jgi:hypothetical protein
MWELGGGECEPGERGPRDVREAAEGGRAALKDQEVAAAAAARVTLE